MRTLFGRHNGITGRRIAKSVVGHGGLVKWVYFIALKEFCGFCALNSAGSACGKRRGRSWRH